MSGQLILLVGGASGLGASCTHYFIDNGDRVAIVDINDDQGYTLVDRIRSQGGDAHYYHCDITSKALSGQVVEQVAKDLGRIDVLVNCAGVYPRKPILEIEDSDWELECAVNIRGTYNMMAHCVKHFVATKASREVAGRVVNVASVDAFKAHPQNAHYAATKAAVVSLTKSFAAEFAPDGVLINGVAPAGIATEKAVQLGFLPELIAASPLGRAAQPEDIADVIGFLASEKNRYMTGETSIVSGGYIYA
jgi:3-oxoacyl-[acyl-carrier protein] reductase